MTRERLKELWPVMEAYKAGQQIQCRLRDSNDQHWRNINEPSWNILYNYRIAPEPREVWVNEYLSGLCWDLFYRNQRDANAGAGTGRIRAVRFVEVVE